MASTADFTAAATAGIAAAARKPKAILCQKPMAVDVKKIAEFAPCIGVGIGECSDLCGLVRDAEPAARVHARDDAACDNSGSIRCHKNSLYKRSGCNALTRGNSRLLSTVTEASHPHTPESEAA